MFKCILFVVFAEFVFNILQVHGGKGENKHRQIHLGGSAQQVGYLVIADVAQNKSLFF